MYLTFDEPVCDQLDIIIDKAINKNRKIKHINLTYDQFNKLSRECKNSSVFVDAIPIEKSKYRGYKIKLAGY